MLKFWALSMVAAISVLVKLSEGITNCQGLSNNLIMNGYCYNAYSYSISASDIRIYCGVQGGDGAVVTNTAEYNAIYSYLRTYRSFQTIYLLGMTIGVSQLFDLDGNVIPYAGNWASTHPQMPSDVGIQTFPNPDNVGNGMITMNGLSPVSHFVCQTLGQCSVLQAPAFGTINCDLSPPNVHDSTCTFGCNGGRYLQGAGSTTCNDNLEWTNAMPDCPRIQCGEPNTQATVLGCSDGYYWGSTCTLSCGQGFELIGFDSITCGGTNNPGTWGPTPPICQPIECSTLSFLVEGNAFFCTNSNNWGSQCAFDCAIGYNYGPGSPVTTTCGGTTDPGSWTPTQPANPTCTIVTCTTLYPWTEANGALSCSPPFVFTDVCTYNCDPGFILQGSEQRQCQSTGEWDGSSGQSCRPVKCSDPAFDTTHGTQACPGGNDYQSTCTSSCESGYELNGDASVMCQQNEQWSGTLPTECTPVSCDVFPYDGTRTCAPNNNPPFSFGTACSIECPQGTELISGSLLLLCLEDGTWSGPPPTCRIRMCSVLEFPPGEVSCTPNNFDYDTVCRYTCNSGYEVDIPWQTVTCELDKTWSNIENMPTACNPVDCGAYGDVEGGSVQCEDGTTYTQICRVSCMTGYSLVQETSRCQANALWSLPRLECSRILCRSLDFNNQPGNMMCDPPGFGYPSTCSFVCHAGYTLKGDKSELTCQIDGSWDGIEPTCKDVICDDLSLEEGTVSCPDGTGYAAVCKFECSFPLKLYGSDETTCLASGEWSHGVPECRKFSPKCDDAIEPLICEDNCDDNSDCEVDEVCCPSSCGLTCKKVKDEPKPKNPFLNINKQTLLLLLAASSRRKPVSRPPVRRPPQCPRCNRNACTTGLHSCPTYLNALCGTTCNGCRAHFLYRNNPRVEVGNRCLCPRNSPPNPRCGGYMCNGVRCANFPQAECRVYGCGPTCYLQFFDRFGRRVLCRQKATCQPGINSVGLCARACLSASCPKYSAAHCRVRCNGCPAEFFDQRTNMPITDCN
ncbi:P-selectin-like [Styela clava]